MTDQRLFDVRVLERNLHKGLITREEYEQFVAKLDDVEGNATAIEAEYIVGVLDEDEEE